MIEQVRALACVPPHLHVKAAVGVGLPFGRLAAAAAFLQLLRKLGQLCVSFVFKLLRHRCGEKACQASAAVCSWVESEAVFQRNGLWCQEDQLIQWAARVSSHSEGSWLAPSLVLQFFVLLVLCSSLDWLLWQLLRFKRHLFVRVPLSRIAGLQS